MMIFIFLLVSIEMTIAHNCENAEHLSNDQMFLIEKLRTEFRNCTSQAIRRWKQRPYFLSKYIANATVNCQKLSGLEDYNFLRFGSKSALLPKCNEIVNFMMLGSDDGSLNNFQTLNQNLDANFYIADPLFQNSITVDEQKSVKHFPFAVGTSTGQKKYRNPNTGVIDYVPTISFHYFVDTMLKLNRIDILWIDMNGSEFDILPFLLSNKLETPICQINIKMNTIYNRPGSVPYHDFVFKILEESTYLIVKNEHISKLVSQIFLINIKDPVCVNKYL